MNRLVVQLLADYNFYRRFTSQYKQSPNVFIRRDLKATKARQLVLEATIHWCAERQLDPRRWLCATFSARRWLFAPQISAGHLQSKKLLDAYRKDQYDVRPYLDRLIQEKPVVPIFDPNVQLSHAAEDAKRFWRSRQNINMCLNNSESYGYHPASGWCNTCAVRAECASRLSASVNFDILALRRGELTPAQAKVQAQHNGGSYN